MLTSRVVVESQPSLTDGASLSKKTQVVRRDAILIQQTSHSGAELATQREIEREILQRVQAVRLVLRRPTRRVKMLDGFALNENGVRPLSENSFDGKFMGHAKIADRSYKGGFTALAFVPPTQ